MQSKIKAQILGANILFNLRLSSRKETHQGRCASHRKGHKCTISKGGLAAGGYLPDLPSIVGRPGRSDLGGDISEGEICQARPIWLGGRSGRGSHLSPRRYGLLSHHDFGSDISSLPATPARPFLSELVPEGRSPAT